MEQPLGVSISEQAGLVETKCVRCHKRILVHHVLQPFCDRCAFILGVSLGEVHLERLLDGDEAEAFSK